MKKLFYKIIKKCYEGGNTPNISTRKQTNSLSKKVCSMEFSNYKKILFPSPGLKI